jgi:hypothetical protein
MGQLYGDDVLWLKRNVCVPTNLANDVTLNNGYVLDSASVSKCNRNDLITHARLALRVKEITPSLRKCLHSVKQPDDPSSATRRTGRTACNRDAPAGFAGQLGRWLMCGSRVQHRNQ